LQSKIIKVGGINFLAVNFDDINADGAKILCEELRAKDPALAAVIASTAENKLTFTAACGANAVKSGANAGNLAKQIAQITGGNGGGKPEFASAGGRSFEKLDEALASGEAILKAMLK